LIRRYLNRMNILKVIRERRSVRKFKAEDVDDKEIERLIDAARWAPSWDNTQCWEFIVVKDPETKEELAKTLNFLNPAREAAKEAPAIIVVCGRKGVSGSYKGIVYLTPRKDWLMFDTALAVQNLCLQAHELGLGTVIIGYFDSKRVAQLLNIPKDVEVVVMILVGRPLETPKAPDRKAISKILHKGKW
jgi:nitroreductase